MSANKFSHFKEKYPGIEILIWRNIDEILFLRGATHPWISFLRELGRREVVEEGMDCKKQTFQCPDSLVLKISLQILFPVKCIVGSDCHMFLHRCYFRLSHGQQGVDVARIFLSVQ